MLSKLSALEARASSIPYLGVLVRASSVGYKDRHKDMAASIAYYTFLSLFPLVLGLIALGGFFLKSVEVQTRVYELLTELLPMSSEFVAQNIDSLIRIRGAAGITSIAVLLWSASKMVGSLSRAINMTLGMKRPYAVYLSSLRYFGLTLIMLIIILLTMALVPFIEILADLQLEVIGDRWNNYLDLFVGQAAGFFTTALLVSVAYKLIPYQRLSWSTLLPGILTASVIIQAGKQVFSWYVKTVTNYDILYGSVSSIIVLLIWMYFTARVLLYGVEVISVTRSPTPTATP